MARIRQNIIVQGMSGAIGKQIVVKRFGNVEVISNYPDMRHVKKSVRQKVENNKFREATIYARTQMLDPIAKAAYKAKAVGLQRAYNVAIADYYHPPEIKNINVLSFYGNAGDRIVVHAIDDFRVERVVVEVRDQGNAVLETGDARQTAEWLWTYLVTKTFDEVKGLTIVANAWDKPGNMTSGKIMLE
jgi:hypothetical protein